MHSAVAHENSPFVENRPNAAQRIEDARARRADLAGGGLVAVPEDVRLDGVKPALLGLPDQIRPHLHAAAETSKERK